MLNSNNWNIILASKSPRRKQLLEQLGYTFTQKSKDTDESFSEEIPQRKVAEYLSVMKAAAFTEEIKQKDLIIASDTIVLIEDEILNKPNTVQEAFEMLSKLSGKQHEVITGVCLKSKEKEVSFSISTSVFFKQLKEDEINYYIEKYKPFDKAGAYGIQEWIGLIGVNKIEGSFYNVMGFPAKAVYEAIERF
ncbi:Maf family nucleotide pyrophosphatase [Vicingaceae bacterium]|nr:Maf family nucleotide pyrophosphatase [Vicingaceae bacterium]MDB4060582.1 Maf family nucleotide pyrophosphatase [Vicingaceae bacterium]MDC1452446.1 Maf family nucleotide pyrophosphatase [Vicingaceae bacterium]